MHRDLPRSREGEQGIEEEWGILTAMADVPEPRTKLAMFPRQLNLDNLLID